MRFFQAATLLGFSAFLSGNVDGAETLIFEDNFSRLDFSKWQHELTLSGGGNWEVSCSLNSLAAHVFVGQLMSSKDFYIIFRDVATSRQINVLGLREAA